MASSTLLALGAAILAGIVVAAGGGFLVGCRYGSNRANRLLNGPKVQAGSILREALASIDVGRRLCEAAAQAARLAEAQVSAIVECQRSLAESVDRLRLAVRSVPETPDEIAWQKEPADLETQLPARAAFESNVAALAAATVEARGGVLLVSLDREDRLRRRIGEQRAAEVRRTVARVLCRTGRDQDLTCVVGSADFALLLPDRDPREALKRSASIREAFRGHPFRLEDGTEVLVTASYGFTPVLSGDDAEIALDRAEAAVARARRWGRNRFFAYDPSAARLTQVADAAV